MDGEELLKCIVYFVESSLVLLFTVPLVVFILYKNERRMRKDYMSICFLTAADIVYAFGFWTSQLRKFLAHESATQMSVFQCAYQTRTIFFLLGIQLLGFSTLFCSFERLYATVRPIAYYNCGVKFTILLLSVPFVLSSTLFLVNLYLIWGDRRMVSINCMTSDVIHPSLHDYYTYQRMGSVFIGILVYLTIGVILKKRKVCRDNGKQDPHLVRATVTIGLTTMSAALLLLVPDILIKFEVGGTSSGYRTFLYCVMLNKTLVNVLIYIVRHREIRRSLNSLIRRRNTVQSTIGSIHGAVGTENPLAPIFVKQTRINSCFYVILLCYTFFAFFMFNFHRHTPVSNIATS